MSQHAETILAAVDSADATSSLIASWRRCALIHGLDPDRTRPPERDTIALRDGLERDARMIAAARPYLDELFIALDDPFCVVALTDETGLVLEQRTGLKQDVWRRAASDIVGTRYSERDLGTNAVGTALVEERAIMIGAGQSFLSRYAAFASVAAPVFGPNGRIAGGLCCAAPRGGVAARDKLALLVVGAFARKIGNEIFAAAFPRARIVQAMPDGAWPCALLAVGADDSVLGATRSARRLLGLTDSRLAAVVGLRDLVGPSDLDDLAGAEARLIAKAMILHANKRTAVAKALGISRSTLYRKLQASRPDAIGATVLGAHASTLVSQVADARSTAEHHGGAMSGRATLRDNLGGVILDHSP